MALDRRSFCYVIFAVFAGTFLAGGGYMFVKFSRWRRLFRERWQKVQFGDAEKAVRELLGTPLREYDRGNAPADYYLPAYAKKIRAISGRVLIYTGADEVFYVWIDEKGQVEDVFHGGS